MPALQTVSPLVEPVTLEEAKAHLRVPHSDDDSYISSLIISARQCVESRTGLLLLAQGWSVFLDDWPEGGILNLPLAPVNQIQDIKVYGEDNTAAIIDPAHYYLDAVSRPPRLVLRASRNWPGPGRLANGIEILLSCGFGAPDAVPKPLRQAVLQLVGHFYATRGEAETPALPLDIGQLLQPFRQVRL